MNAPKLMFRLNVSIWKFQMLLTKFLNQESWTTEIQLPNQIVFIAALVDLQSRRILTNSKLNLGL